MNPGFSLIGARTDLGLSIRWRFSFLDAGSVASRGSDVIYLDVGGHLEPGVIDHHQGTPGATSTARLVFTHPDLVHEHLVGPWVAIARTAETRGRTWTPTIALHAAPDLDALVSAALAIELVEHGRFPRRASDLVDYADRVDQGAERPSLPDQRFELYPLILMLQNLPKDAAHRDRAGLPESTPTQEMLAGLAGNDSIGVVAEAAGDERMLRLGMHLVRRWLDARAKGPGGEAVQLREEPVAMAIAAAIEADAGRFEQAMRQGRIECTGVRLPCVDRLAPAIEVPAAVLRQGDAEVGGGTIACDKIYLRIGAAGLDRPCPVTVIEKTPPAGEGPPRSRWIIAIDEAAPPSDPASRANLRGLGASLEWAEQRARARLGVDPGVRRGATRFPEFPGLADPWYDGRGHGWTIVDSPRDGTVLAQVEIEGVLRSRFWEPETEAAVAFVWRGHDGRRRPVALSQRSSGGAPCRLGDVIEAARGGLQPSSGDGGLFTLLALHVRTGWDEAATVDTLRDLLGGTPEPLHLSIGRAFVGPSACVVLMDRAANPFEPEPTLDGLFELLCALRRIDEAADRIGDASGRETTIGLCRDERERFARATARYRSLPQPPTADSRLLQGAIEEAVGLDARLGATGQLIEHLHEESERCYEGRLSRIGLVLAAFVLVEVGIAALGASSQIGRWWTSDHAFGRIWPLVALGMFGVLAVLAVMLLVRRFDRGLSKLPLIGPLLFPEMQSLQPGDRRRQAGER